MAGKREKGGVNKAGSGWLDVVKRANRSKDRARQKRRWSEPLETSTAWRAKVQGEEQGRKESESKRPQHIIRSTESYNPHQK